MDDSMTTVERLVRIETKLDAWLLRSDDHESRLRKLERALWIGMGATAVVGGALGGGVAKLIGA